MTHEVEVKLLGNGKLEIRHTFDGQLNPLVTMRFGCKVELKLMDIIEAQQAELFRLRNRLLVCIHGDDDGCIITDEGCAACLTGEPPLEYQLKKFKEQADASKSKSSAVPGIHSNRESSTPGGNKDSNDA